MKALVLFSGGVDSSTCLGMAVDKFGAENVHNAFYDAEALAKIYRAVYCSEHNDHLRYLEYINVRT